MPLEVHQKNISKILSHKSHTHLSISHITDILAAIPSIFTSKSTTSDLTQSLESILNEGKPENYRSLSKNIVEDLVSLFKECMKLINEEYIQRQKKIVYSLIKFSMTIIQPLLPSLKATIMKQLINSIERLSLSFEVGIIEGVRIKCKHFIVLTFLQSISSSNTRYQQLIQEYLEYVFENYTTLSKVEEVVSSWLKCYGSLNFPVLYHLLSSFLKRHQSEASANIRKLSISSFYEPKIIAFIISKLMQFKNLLEVEQFHTKLPSFKCGYCGLEKKKQAIQFQIKAKNHCYIVCICKGCRKEVPENKYEALLPLGVGSYNQELFIHENVKQTISNLYTMITKETPPFFIYHIPTHPDSKILQSKLIRRIMFQSSLKPYLQALLTTILLFGSNSNDRIRLKTMKNLYNILEEWKELQQNQTLFRIVKKRILDVDNKVKKEAIKIFLLIGGNILQLLDSITNIQNQSLMENLSEVFYKHMSKNIEKFSGQNFYEVCIFFVNYLCIKENQNIEKNLINLMKNIEKKDESKYFFMLKSMLFSPNANSLQYNKFMNLVPTFPTNFLAEIQKKIQINGSSEMVWNKRVICELMEKTDILKTVLEDFEKIIKKQQKISIENIETLLMLMRIPQKKNILGKKLQTLEKIFSHILMYLTFENMSQIEVLCELICILNFILQKNNIMYEFIEKNKKKLLSKNHQESILGSGILIFIHKYGTIVSSEDLSKIEEKLLEIWLTEKLYGMNHMYFLCYCWEKNQESFLNLKISKKKWQQVSQYLVIVYRIIQLFLKKKKQISTLEKVSQIFRDLHEYSNESIQFYTVVEILDDKGLILLMKGNWNKYIIRGLMSHNSSEIQNICSKIIHKYISRNEGQTIFHHTFELLEYLQAVSQEQNNSYLVLKNLYEINELNHIQAKKLRMRVTFVKKLAQQLNRIGYEGIIWKNKSIIFFINRIISCLHVIDLFQYTEILGAYQTIVGKYYFQSLKADHSQKQIMISIMRTYAYLLQGYSANKVRSILNSNVIELQNIQYNEKQRENEDILEFYYSLTIDGKEEEQTNSTKPKENFSRIMKSKRERERRSKSDETRKSTMEVGDYRKKLRKRKLEV